MDKNIVINQLANDLSSKEMTKQEREQTFEKLYVELSPMFGHIINGYMMKANLTGFNFDMNDYISILGQSVVESVQGYSILKGDYIARLRAFSYKRFKNVTQYNLAEKRFDKKKQVYSFDELPENAEFAVEDLTVDKETPQLISQFIKGDKEGEVIRLLCMNIGSSKRKQALESYFGGEYNSAARKKVQRVRERLAKHLALNGISI